MPKRNKQESSNSKSTQAKAAVDPSNLNPDQNIQQIKAWLEKARLLIGQTRYEDAITCLDEVLKLSPNDADILFNKGGIYKALGKFPEALTCFDRALAIDLNHVNAWYNKGLTHYAVDKPIEAIACYDKAFSLNPSDRKILMSREIAVGSLQGGKQAISSNLIEITQSVIHKETQVSTQVTQGIELVEISQYGVAKISRDATEKTSNLRLVINDLVTSLGICAISENKIVLIHTDTNVHTDSIAEQCNGLEAPYKLAIIKNQAALKLSHAMNNLGGDALLGSFLERLQQSLSNKAFPAWTDITLHNTRSGSVIVKSNGELIMPDKPISGKKADDYELRKAINSINYLTNMNCESAYTTLDLDIQYDNGNWNKAALLGDVGIKLVNFYQASKDWGDFIQRLDSAADVYASLSRLIALIPQVKATLKLALEKYLSLQKTLINPAVQNSLSATHTDKDESIIINAKEVQLNQQTKALYSKLPASSWRIFPKEKLTGKYVGHQLRFFTLPADENAQAKQLCEELKKLGFDTELKSAKDKPALVVDLTTSVLRET